jgi:hypothetical protein
LFYDLKELSVEGGDGDFTFKGRYNSEERNKKADVVCTRKK